MLFEVRHPGAVEQVRSMIAMGMRNLDIAALLGCSSTYVSMIRTGKRPWTAETIAQERRNLARNRKLKAKKAVV